MFEWLKKKTIVDKVGLLTAEEAHVQTLTSNTLLKSQIHKTSLNIMEFHKENIEMVAKQIRNATEATGGWYDTNFSFYQLKLPSRNLWTKEFDALVDQLEHDLISKGYQVEVTERKNNNIYKGNIKVSWREIMPPEGERGVHIKTANIR